LNKAKIGRRRCKIDPDISHSYRVGNRCPSRHSKRQFGISIAYFEKSSGLVQMADDLT
jgi:hypothetical protein